MKIEMGKKYRTMDGRPVRILCVDRHNLNYPVVALTGKEQSINSFTIEGLFAPGANSELNIIEVPPYDHLRVDDKVVVWNKDVRNAKKRYFAGTNEYGRALAFYIGGTSFSQDETNNEATIWPNCLSISDFMKQYPDEAKKMGLENFKL